MDQDSLETHVAERPYADVANRLRSAMGQKNIRGGSMLRDVLLAKYADAAPLSPQAVSKWLTGKGLPDSDNLKRLAGLLALTEKEILGRHAPPKPGRKKPKTLDADLVYSLTPLAMEYGHRVLVPPLVGVAPRTVAKARDMDHDLSREIHDFLSDACEDNPDLAVVHHFRVRGPYFRGLIDFAVLRKGDPEFAIEVISGVGEQIPSLLGKAHNWALTTSGKPLFVIWITPTNSTTDPLIARAERELGLLAKPENAPSVIADFFVSSLQAPADAGLQRFFERMPSVIRAISP